MKTREHRYGDRTFPHDYNEALFQVEFTLNGKPGTWQVNEDGLELALLAFWECNDYPNAVITNCYLVVPE